MPFPRALSGYGDYTTANSSLDSLSRGRSIQGIATTSVQWPQLFGDVGMGAVGIAKGQQFAPALVPWYRT
jgi:hypothetical protein